MSIPSWYVLLLLSLAAYRSTRLVGWDVLTRGLRVRVTHRSEIDGTVYIGKGSYRRRTDEFLHCPWCLGFWVALAWWGAWGLWPHPSLVVATPLALSAIIGLIGRNLDS